VQCKPNADRNLGLVNAFDVKESKSVVISAFSSDLAAPHGELDPAVNAALLRFRRALEGNHKFFGSMSARPRTMIAARATDAAWQTKRCGDLASDRSQHS
jgi:hypothetical protein